MEDSVLLPPLLPPQHPLPINPSLASVTQTLPHNTATPPMMAHLSGSSPIDSRIHEPNLSEVWDLQDRVALQGRLYTPPPICTACMEPADKVAILPCEHQYCSECLAHMFENAISNEASFPPHCCGQPLALQSAHYLLDPELLKRYMKAKAEFSTTRRVYCYETNCAAFIHSSSIENDVAICGKCGRATCTQCTNKAHEPLEACSETIGVPELEATAAQQGWQRCPACNRMVERTEGCSHMTCVCGNHFCYQCGEQLNHGFCICARNELFEIPQGLRRRQPRARFIPPVDPLTGNPVTPIVDHRQLARREAIVAVNERRVRMYEALNRHRNETPLPPGAFPGDILPAAPQGNAPANPATAQQQPNAGDRASRGTFAYEKHDPIIRAWHEYYRVLGGTAVIEPYVSLADPRRDTGGRVQTPPQLNADVRTTLTASLRTNTGPPAPREHARSPRAMQVDDARLNLWLEDNLIVQPRLTTAPPVPRETTTTPAAGRVHSPGELHRRSLQTRPGTPFSPIPESVETNRTERGTTAPPAMPRPTPSPTARPHARRGGAFPRLTLPRYTGALPRLLRLNRTRDTASNAADTDVDRDAWTAPDDPAFTAAYVQEVLAAERARGNTDSPAAELMADFTREDDDFTIVDRPLSTSRERAEREFW
ncbi:hypothetical protein BDW74DRAFT_172896 [Aspergillus multicolor]|uniref:uncharacterized protein n=1 Tax=Aspergillus multicolor TaxID=41759 RepID=UPI003CCE12B3